MSERTLKRRFLNESFENLPKRFKDFNESDSDESDNELQIDLDDHVTQIDDGAPEHGVSWTRLRQSDYISVTLSTGHRCFVSVTEDDTPNTSVRRSESPKVASAEYYRLLDEAEELLRRQREKHSRPSSTAPQIRSNQLWVTKYTPRRYIDLLSPEPANRYLLSWLKSWDKHIFEKESRLTDRLKQGIPSSASGFPNYDEMLLQIDQRTGLPLRRVVLLAGPPGLGKTTLAHIVATRCGYLPEEINASDDRSPESFRIRLEALNYTRRGVNFNSDHKYFSKPCCLILDEIDGASAAAVNVLVNAINASNIVSKSSMDSNENKKKEKHKLKINCPVICICNDLYAPSLKQLKPLCYIIKITPPDFNQLLQRLSDICKVEEIDCNRSILTNLIDISNRDIRSCLNSLQFLKQQGIDSVENSHLSSLNIGQKDIEVNTFKVWQDIFTDPDIKKSHYLTERTNSRDLSLRFNHVLTIAQSSGDIDRVISGIHENYLSVVRFKDIFLKGMVDASEWIVFNDLANKQINTKQIYDMFKYKQYLIPFFHLSFASSAISPGSIHWPVSEMNAHFALQKIQAIYDSFIDSQGCVSQWIKSKEEVIKYVIPSLVSIIRPAQLRPINTQLYSNKEKAILESTVNIMISTGLNYVQERMAELQYQYVLSPNIEEICCFNLTNFRRMELTYSTKQLIANEINRVKIKKSGVDRNKHLEETDLNINERPQNRIEFIMQKTNEMKAKRTIICENKRKAFDFRLGPKVAKVTEVQASDLITTLLKQAVWFKFKEGFTNAIKRPVQMKDL